MISSDVSHTVRRNAVIALGLVYADAPDAFVSTALLLLLGGMILVVLGIMGEYVGRIYMCANAAPQYVEREVIRHEEDDA